MNCKFRHVAFARYRVKNYFFPLSAIISSPLLSFVLILACACIACIFQRSTMRRARKDDIEAIAGKNRRLLTFPSYIPFASFISRSFSYPHSESRQHLQLLRRTFAIASLHGEWKDRQNVAAAELTEDYETIVERIACDACECTQSNVLVWNSFCFIDRFVPSRRFRSFSFRLIVPFWVSEGFLVKESLQLPLCPFILTSRLLALW